MGATGHPRGRCAPKSQRFAGCKARVVVGGLPVHRYWVLICEACMTSSTTMRTMISDTVVARSAQNGAKKGDRMAFCMVFGSFLGERQPNCCRVFSSLFPGPLVSG